MADKDHAGGSESKGKGKEKISRGGLDIADLERINLKLESIRRERERELLGAAYETEEERKRELLGAAYEEKAPIPGKQSEDPRRFTIQGQFTVTHWHEDELRRYEEEAKRIRAERELLFASNEENAPIHRQQSDEIEDEVQAKTEEKAEDDIDLNLKL